MNKRKDKILVLGAASWLGYLLLEELNRNSNSFELAGTFNKQTVSFIASVKTFNASRLIHYRNILAEYKPTIIVNFLRGEDEEGMQIHKTVTEYLKSINGYYIFASSALALDGHKKTELTETVLANSKSEYGIFKAKVEQDLYDSDMNWCILRFSSVQGWVAHKKTRNEVFLNKLSNGEEIIVDRGVIQNRMFADLMITGIAQLIHRKITGIIHFGTIDSSDEIEFLKKQADLFGFPSQLIKEGKIVRDVNLVCIPNKIHKLFGNQFQVVEDDTLKSLSKIDAFQKYKIK